MLELTHIHAVALKDQAKLLGLVLRQAQEVDLDLLADQLPLVQAAVDAGEVQVVGLPAAELPAPAPKKAKG